MPILHDFEYYRPTSVKEAVRLLSRHNKAAILAGGTDLIPEMKQTLRIPDAIIDIKNIGQLRKIKLDKEALSIGALTTFSDILDSKLIFRRLPVLHEICQNVASPGIRNRATLIGNICSAVPCMDSGPILTALDAQVVTIGMNGKRRIPAGAWFKGNRKTAIKKTEVVTEVIIPLPPLRHGGCYVKLGRYNGQDLALASVLVIALPKQNFRVAFGSLGPVPIRAVAIEQLLANGPKIEQVLPEAKAMIPKTIFPITDIRASREYRLHLAQVMFQRALTAAINRLNGGGPEYGERLI